MTRGVSLTSFKARVGKWLKAHRSAVPVGRLLGIPNPESDVIEAFKRRRVLVDHVEVTCVGIHTVSLLQVLWSLRTSYVDHANRACSVTLENARSHVRPLLFGWASYATILSHTHVSVAYTRCLGLALAVPLAQVPILARLVSLCLFPGWNSMLLL